MPDLQFRNCGLTLARPGPIARIDRCPHWLHGRRASIVLLDWCGPRARLSSAEAWQVARRSAPNHGRDVRTAV